MILYKETEYLKTILGNPKTKGGVFQCLMSDNKLTVEVIRLNQLILVKQVDTSNLCLRLENLPEKIPKSDFWVSQLSRDTSPSVLC